MMASTDAWNKSFAIPQAPLDLKRNHKPANHEIEDDESFQNSIKEFTHNGNNFVSCNKTPNTGETTRLAKLDKNLKA